MHLGYNAQDFESPFAKFYRPVLAPLASHVREALLRGAAAPPLFLPFEEAPALLDRGYWPLENGYAVCPDGSARVFVLTQMPRVTPEMWSWWFAWHGSDARRYKLWHPQAHVHAAWEDGRSDLDTYVGRTSHVVEYIGSALLKLDIQFVPPKSLGFDEEKLGRDEIVICARGALSGTPMNTGWLIHHVRAVGGGSEMRSRFWIGGSHVQPRGMDGAIGRMLGRAASALNRPTTIQARELLVHCAQEMSHLASFLPELYRQFGADARRRKTK